MKVYVFGNEYFGEDSMAKRVADLLPRFDFIYCNSLEDAFGIKDGDVVLDVAINVDRACKIDVSDLANNPLYSLHDMDLSFFLRLKKEMGVIDAVSIIAVPKAGDVQSIANDVDGFLCSFLTRNLS